LPLPVNDPNYRCSVYTEIVEYWVDLLGLVLGLVIPSAISVYLKVFEERVSGAAA
jgi:hypothetical protein